MKCEHYPVLGNDLWTDDGSSDREIVMKCTRCGQVERMERNTSPLEFIPQRMKDDRQKYQKSTLQPFRDGVLSSEFVQTYGTSSLNVTKEDVRKSKPVWKDTLKSGWEKSQ